MAAQDNRSTRAGNPLVGSEPTQIVYALRQMADALNRQNQILQNIHNLLQMRQANGK